MKKIINRRRGFTIVELIIATTVFSTMLLLTTTGMIQIGRVYYKGLITSKTQETARSVSDEIVRSIQFGGDAVLRHNPSWPAAGENVNGNGFATFAACMNNVRYSYILNTRLASLNNASPPRTAVHVLYLDVIKDSSSCYPLDLTQPDPTDSNTDTTADATAQRRELLATNMRLGQFDLTGTANLVNIQLKVVYGQDDVVNDPNNDGNYNDATCASTGSGGQFCAFSALNTFAKRRL